MEEGTFSYSEIDASYYIKDKRGLVAQEDVPNMVGMYFKPDSGSEATYICNVTCHPTSISASHQYVSSDYIYYMDKYIKEKTGANLVVVQGALGQMSRENIRPDETGMTEMETWGSDTKLLGEIFADYLLKADYKPLKPILNVKHKELWIQAENSILALACEIELVNNQVYILEDGNVAIASELGYLEFGHEIGFAMFPGELYPEVFWGSEVIGGTNWDGSEWPYESLHNSVDGVKVYAMSLTNDATGYTLTDNNFAFMGHIIGDSISDELLSPGKHIGSYYVSNYLDLVNEYTK